MSKTSIQWTGRSWGYQQGCSPKSPGCPNCYAEKIAKRLAKNPNVPQYTDEIALWNGAMNLHIPGLVEPLLQRKGTTWFPSMTDPFHPNVHNEWIGLAILVAALCPQHRFLMLTKRPEGILEWLNSSVCDEFSQSGGAFAALALHWMSECGLEDWWDLLEDAISRYPRTDTYENFPIPNTWLGASVEDQKRADERMPLMHELKKKGWHTFISAEPLLEKVDLHLDKYPVDWVIIGGESGSKSRPFNLNWGRSLIWQCQDNGIKVFFKQMGGNATDSVPYIPGTLAESVNWQVEFKDKKGGTLEEWPREFQIREVPKILQIA
jgi:protein gp37